MKIILRATRAFLAAAAVALLAVASAPSAHAQSASPVDTVLVPRITKGAYGNLIRVKDTSAQARLYFALIAHSEASGSANCPCTTCAKTTACHDTKGALGAGCITH